MYIYVHSVFVCAHTCSKVRTPYFTAHNVAGVIYERCCCAKHFCLVMRCTSHNDIYAQYTINAQTFKIRTLETAKGTMEKLLAERKKRERELDLLRTSEPRLMNELSTLRESMGRMRSEMEAFQVTCTVEVLCCLTLFMCNCCTATITVRFVQCQHASAGSSCINFPDTRLGAAVVWKIPIIVPARFQSLY